MLLGVLTAWAGGGVREGMSRAEVEAALGRPVSALVKGDTVILRYPNNGRVELVKDKAVVLVRVLHADEVARAEAEAAAAQAVIDAELAAEAAEAKAAEKAAAQAEAANARAAAAAAARGEPVALPAGALQDLERVTEGLANAHGQPGGPGAQSGAHAGATSPLIGGEAHGIGAGGGFWVGLVAMFLVQFAVGMVALKLAFKWADVHAEWSQMPIPALANAFTLAFLRAGAFALWRAPDLFYVDHAVALLVMLIVLRKTTHACTLPRAVAVAMAAKLTSFVVWVVLSVFVMNAIAALR